MKYESYTVFFILLLMPNTLISTITNLNFKNMIPGR